jgi:CheY-like chemotaxis protein
MPGELVLIVDDNDLNLKLTKVLLEKEGFAVATAQDSEEALVFLGTLRPRLILMDIQLPGMDGLTLTGQLKADPVTSGIIILALTAYVMKGDEEKALAAGCDGYIPKPIDTQKLPHLLREYLSKKKE